MSNHNRKSKKQSMIINKMRTPRKSSKNSMFGHVPKYKRLKSKMKIMKDRRYLNNVVVGEHPWREDDDA